MGGLLFLLPQMFSFANKDDKGSNHRDHGQELMKKTMAELEQLLIHANIPVSKTDLNSFNFCTTFYCVSFCNVIPLCMYFYFYFFGQPSTLYFA